MAGGVRRQHHHPHRSAAVVGLGDRELVRGCSGSRVLLGLRPWQVVDKDVQRWLSLQAYPVPYTPRARLPPAPSNAPHHHMPTPPPLLQWATATSCPGPPWRWGCAWWCSCWASASSAPCCPPSLPSYRGPARQHAGGRVDGGRVAGWVGRTHSRSPKHDPTPPHPAVPAPAGVPPWRRSWQA